MINSVPSSLYGAEGSPSEPDPLLLPNSWISLKTFLVDQSVVVGHGMFAGLSAEGADIDD